MSDYINGIPTDTKLLRTAINQCSGNEDLARERLERVLALARHYQRETSMRSDELERWASENPAAQEWWDEDFPELQ